MNRGIYFTTETVLALLLLSALILSFSPPLSDSSLARLSLQQQSHDLQLLWAREGIPSLETMASDARRVFPTQSIYILRNTQQWQQIKEGPVGNRIRTTLHWVEPDGSVIFVELRIDH